MYSFYWDASALAKRYAPEVGTPLVNALFSQVALKRMLCLHLGVGEILSVLVRKRNAGRIPPQAFAQALVDFRTEVLNSTDFQLLAIDDLQLFASHPFIERYDKPDGGSVWYDEHGKRWESYPALGEHRQSHGIRR